MWQTGDKKYNYKIKIKKKRGVGLKNEKQFQKPPKHWDNNQSTKKKKKKTENWKQKTLKKLKMKVIKNSKRTKL